MLISDGQPITQSSFHRWSRSPLGGPRSPTCHAPSPTDRPLHCLIFLLQINGPHPIRGWLNSYFASCVKSAMGAQPSNRLFAPMAQIPSLGTKVLTPTHVKLAMDPHHPNLFPPMVQINTRGLHPLAYHAPSSCNWRPTIKSSHSNSPDSIIGRQGLFFHMH